jgi:hypothetical protein
MNMVLKVRINLMDSELFWQSVSSPSLTEKCLTFIWKAMNVLFCTNMHTMSWFSLKVHKRDNCLGFDFEICTFS